MVDVNAKYIMIEGFIDNINKYCSHLREHIPIYVLMDLRVLWRLGILVLAYTV